MTVKEMMEEATVALQRIIDQEAERNIEMKELKERLKNNPFTRSNDVGKVVYWVEYNSLTGFPNIHYGVIDDVFMTEVKITPLAHKERLFFEGQPVDKFISTPWRKLPKGWSWQTQLFSVESKPVIPFEELKKYKINNPDDILKLVELGYLAPENEIDYGHLESDVGSDGHKGQYRIVKKYDWDAAPHGRSIVSLTYDKVFRTFEEAKEKIKADREEQIRVSNLSDQEYAEEEMDKVLAKYQKFNSLPEEDIQRVRSRLLEMENFTDIEFRFFGANLEWKYMKNKKWNTLGGE